MLDKPLVMIQGLYGTVLGMKDCACGNKYKAADSASVVGGTELNSIVVQHLAGVRRMF